MKVVNDPMLNLCFEFFDSGYLTFVDKPVMMLASAPTVPDMFASAADLGWGVFAVRPAAVLNAEPDIFVIDKGAIPSVFGNRHCPISKHYLHWAYQRVGPWLWFKNENIIMYA